MMLVGFNSQTSWRVNNFALTIYHQFNGTTGQNRQMAELVLVLDKHMPRWYQRFFGVNACAEMVVDHDTSRPLARMLTDVAPLAMVEMKPPGDST